MPFPVTLNGRTYTDADFAGAAYVTGLPSLMQDAATHFAQGYVGTSTTSTSVGTGTKTITVEANKLYAAGQPVVIASTANPTTVYMDGRVSSYTASTGVLVVIVDVAVGSGTLSAWTVTIGGARISTSLPLGLSNGGTGATTAGGALTNLGVGSAGQTLIAQTTQTALRTTGLGFTAFGESVATAADAAAGRTALGISSVASTFAAQTTQATMRTTGLGITTLGDSLATAADAASARTTIGSGEKHIAGSTSTPSVSFAADPNTGIYNSNTDEIGLAAGGSDAGRIHAGGLRLPQGSQGTPALSQISDTDTGLYFPTANTVSLSAGGSEKLKVETSLLRVFDAEFLAAIPNYITGMNLIQNTTDSVNDIDFTAGACASTDNLSLIRNSSTVTKRLDASWTAGAAGGLLDTGTRAVSTWYYLFAIYNPTTRVSDFLASTSASSPTLPSGFTRFRRIGAVYSDSSNSNKSWKQFGRVMLWNTPVLSATTDTLSGTAANFAVLVPDQIDVEANINVSMNNASNGSGYVRSVSQGDNSPGASTGFANLYFNGGSAWSSGMMTIPCASTANIRASAEFSSTKLRVLTLGYEDLLTKDGVMG